MEGVRPWRLAWADAHHGPGGFYRRAAPAEHFRTSVHASPLFAGAIHDLLCRVDALLGRPDPIDLVDVGAGRAELLGGVRALAAPDLAARLRLTAVELADRPADLTADIRWTPEVPALTGLLVANEWLDDVPLDVVENGRLVLVAPDGTETPGGPVPPADADWLARWWPGTGRAEIGRSRDEAWAGAVRAVRRGAAIAIDYMHTVADRPPDGSLVGYARGRAVPPVPDGSANLTAHVALDACAEAGRRAGATATLLTTQRAALRALGVTGGRPPLALASSDPTRYLRELAAAGEGAELIERAGLGGFGWLVQSVGISVPMTVTE